MNIEQFFEEKERIETAAMNVYTSESQIHGKGWHALCQLKPGDPISPGKANHRCLINHSEDPNTERDADYRLLPKNDRPCICSRECYFVLKC